MSHLFFRGGSFFILQRPFNLKDSYFVSPNMENNEAAKPLTLVLGATPNTSRYANIATHRLLQFDFPVALVGIKEGNISGLPIQQGLPSFESAIDTVTLYIGPKHHWKNWSVSNSCVFYTMVKVFMSPSQLLQYLGVSIQKKTWLEFGSKYK